MSGCFGFAVCFLFDIVDKWAAFTEESKNGSARSCGWQFSLLYTSVSFTLALEEEISKKLGNLEKNFDSLLTLLPKRPKMKIASKGGRALLGTL